MPKQNSQSIIRKDETLSFGGQEKSEDDFSDKLGEKCAVFGVYGKDMDVSRLTFFGLFALQHRGQESSGMAVSDGETIKIHKDMGLVAQVFNEELIESMKGHISIGHNRYSTSKTSTVAHAQPFISADNSIALVHNGNLPSTEVLKDFLMSKGVIAEGHSDSCLMKMAIHWYIKQGDKFEVAVKKAYPLFTGAFSALIMTKDTMIAIRDSNGIRPLSLAKLNGGYIFSSETCAFGPMGAKFIREVLPGEMVVLDEQGLRSEQLAEPNQKLDIFEFVYFARHDSTMLGKLIYDVRKNFGRQLAKEWGLVAGDIDIVIPVPETSQPMAIGFSQQSGVPYEMGLQKNRYIQRTFINPDQKMRQQGVKMKMMPLPEVIAGKRVAVIDDSIVRGTTSREVVKMLFDAGAKEVHFLSSSAPIRFPDFYGIDIPDQKLLLAFNKSVEEMREYLGATSLHFLSVKGMIDATGLDASQLNTSCFTGTYPIDIKERALEFYHPTEPIFPESAPHETVAIKKVEA